MKLRSTIERDHFRIASCKNILSPSTSIKLHNSRIIEEDFHENDCDDIMPRLEEQKLSLGPDSEKSGSQDQDFFSQEENSEGTPRFKQQEYTVTLAQLGDEM